jgi:hypothetical protein
MPTRTPRLHNLIPNSAPVLAAMSDKFGYAGQTLQFIVSATDAESLVQTLTFNLIVPLAGATLHPGTGAFVWNIPPNTIPGTNLVTIQATDDGTPVLSDVKNFNVIIRPVPQLASSVSGNQLQLSWPALETGWWLEAQTNSLSVGLDGNWFPIPGSSETNQIFLPINPAHGSVFLRLVAP